MTNQNQASKTERTMSVQKLITPDGEWDMRTSQQENRDEIAKVVDPGIRHEVMILIDNGIETFESCQGGDDHASPEPIVKFFGNASEGYRAVAVALTHGLKVSALRRVWSVDDGELVGPYWELTFYRTSAD